MGLRLRYNLFYSTAEAVYDAFASFYERRSSMLRTADDGRREATQSKASALLCRPGRFFVFTCFAVAFGVALGCTRLCELRLGRVRIWARQRDWTSLAWPCRGGESGLFPRVRQGTRDVMVLVLMTRFCARGSRLGCAQNRMRTMEPVPPMGRHGSHREIQIVADSRPAAAVARELRREFDMRRSGLGRVPLSAEAQSYKKTPKFWSIAC
jgi:hypothetical protein